MHSTESSQVNSLCLLVLHNVQPLAAHRVKISWRESRPVPGLVNDRPDQPAGPHLQAHGRAALLMPRSLSKLSCLSRAVHDLSRRARWFDAVQSSAPRRDMRRSSDEPPHDCENRADSCRVKKRTVVAQRCKPNAVGCIPVRDELGATGRGPNILEVCDRPELELVTPACTKWPAAP